MQVAVRATGAAILALVAAVLLALTSTMTSVFTFAAVASTTALIMGGTGDPLSTPPDELSFVQQYLDMAVGHYISPATGIPAGLFNAVAVITPEEWSTNGGLTLDQSIALGQANLDNCIKATSCVYNPDVGSTAPASADTFVVFGYSQSATVGTFEKRSLAAEFPVGLGPDVTFVFIGNGNRPNGGFLARGPQGFTIPEPLIFAGATFSGPTPTNTQYSTVDIAEQYDVWADVPVNPLNVLALLNWYMSDVHYDYNAVSLSDPGIVYQGQVGDTTYYLIPTPILPLVKPLEQVPVVGYALADALDAPLRVLVEAGYDRTTSPGQPTPWNPLYFPNPIALAINFVVAIPTGMDNGLQDLIGIRPFGTQRPGPYGVGGPDVTYLNPSESTATMQSAAPTMNGVAPVSISQGLPPLMDANIDITVPASIGRRFNAVSDVVPQRSWTAGPSPLSGAKLTNDSFALALPTHSSGGPKPDDGIRAAAVGIQHSLPGSLAVDVSAPGVPTTQSSGGPKPDDGIGAVAAAIRQPFSSNIASTSTPTARPSSVTSAKPRFGTSSAESSPGNDSSSLQSGRHRAK